MTPPTRACLKIQNNNTRDTIRMPFGDKYNVDFTTTKPNSKLSFNITTGNILSGNKTNFGGSRR